MIIAAAVLLANRQARAIAFVVRGERPFGHSKFDLLLLPI
jgi:hypothetical protein